MTASCRGGHGTDEHGHDLYCEWCPIMLDSLNDINRLRKACKAAYKELSLLVTTRQDMRTAWDKCKAELEIAIKLSERPNAKCICGLTVNECVGLDTNYGCCNSCNHNGVTPT